MSDDVNLFSYLEKSSTKTSLITFYDEKSKQNINYKTLMIHIENISSVINSIFAFNELICCVIKASYILPAVTLGILKSSSAFSFLDISAPFSSFQNVRKYVSCRVLFTEENYSEELKSRLCTCWTLFPDDFLKLHGLCLFYVSTFPCSEDKCQNLNYKSLSCFKCDSSLAYVVQTSGTTGNSKVVQVPHQCILPNIINLRCIYNVKAEDVILLCSPLTFDPSIIEIFLALTFGATLIIVPDYIRCVPSKLSDVITDCKVTILQVTPSLLQRFNDGFIVNTLFGKTSPLRVLAFGGEQCPSKLKLRKWISPGNKVELYNLYGITEVSCWSTFEKIDIFNCVCNDVPLGSPLQDTILEVKNDEGEVLCEGEGQLFIGGLKRWCVINDESWPQVSCPIMRATGDWVTKTERNQIWFLGRKDDIIKNNGKKISLLAVRSRIEAMPEVCNHALHFDQVNSKLLLFLVLNSEFNRFSEVNHGLLSQLRDSVPNLPATQIVPVPFIPTTKHGKVDFRKLCKLKETSLKRKADSCDSKTSYEDVALFVSFLWKDYTKVNEISDTDNFIHNGGNSITSIEFASEIEWKFGVTIPLLVDTFLTASFKDVCHVILSYVHNVKEILNSDKEGKFICAKKNTPDYIGASSKKISMITSHACCKMASRRGVQLFGDYCDISKSDSFKRPFIDCDKLNLCVKFTIDLKKCVDASPCIVHLPHVDSQLVFIGSHSGLFCAVDVRTGVEKWNIQLKDRIESSACLSTCGKFVLIGCYDYNIYCFNVEQGDLTWKIETEAEVKSSPVVSPDNNAFVGSHDQHLYAIDIEKGSIIWKKRIGCGSIFSSPAISQEYQCVCAATLDGVIALLDQNSGDMLWRYEYNKPLFSSPLFHTSSIFIGCTDGYMLQFNINGNIVMKYFVDGPIFSSPSLFQHTFDNQFKIIFGSHDCHLYCISDHGELVWKTFCESAVYSTSFIFYYNGKQLVAAASTKGSIFILDATNGETVCIWNCSGEIFSSPVVFKNYVLVGCRDNNLYCFQLC